jgi:uncharacterized protein YeaO (DUF488 family)
MKDVAPSDALRRWYGHDAKKWLEFRRRYFAELDSNRKAWEPILEAARRADVILCTALTIPSITTPQRCATIWLRS